jgi:hypothetical protein
MSLQDWPNPPARDASSGEMADRGLEYPTAAEARWAPTGVEEIKRSCSIVRWQDGPDRPLQVPTTVREDFFWTDSYSGVREPRFFQKKP